MASNSQAGDACRIPGLPPRIAVVTNRPPQAAVSQDANIQPAVISDCIRAALQSQCITRMIENQDLFPVMLEPRARCEMSVGWSGARRTAAEWARRNSIW